MKKYAKPLIAIALIVLAVIGYKKGWLKRITDAFKKPSATV